jgi:SAM-dependent methyltransferase
VRSVSDRRHLARTRAAYDTVSQDYERLLRDELAQKPLDRGLLSTFAAVVARDGGGRVVDAGCGPGRITQYLRDLGVDAYGVDLSHRMIDVARRSYPGLCFEVGDIAALPEHDGALAGVVAWYSTIHTPVDALCDVFGEFRRALRAGGWLLLAFHIGDGPVHRTQAYGHAVDLDSYYLPVTDAVARVEQAGFGVQVRVEREPEPPEKSRQAYVVAQANAPLGKGPA